MLFDIVIMSPPLALQSNEYTFFYKYISHIADCDSVTDIRLFRNIFRLVSALETPAFRGVPSFDDRAGAAGVAGNGLLGFSDIC